MNTTFTTCAEKKAKQFLNLLQGYTKGIRITAILILLLMGVGNIWAATTATLYYSVPASTVGCYTVKCYYNFGYDQSGLVEMTKVDKTSSGNLIYSVKLTANHDNVDNLLFQLFDGNTWKSEQQVMSDWKPLADNSGKMYVHNTGWKTYSTDAAYTVYFVNKDSWDGTIKAYAWNSDCDKNKDWSGADMTSTGKTYQEKNIYSITLNKRYANIIFNNGSSQTDDLTLGSTNIGKMYDGSNWVDYNVDPVVTFKANGGTGSDYTQTVKYNTSTALTANTFTRTGYTFAGWNTKTDGTGTSYTDKQKVTLKANTILYAKWTEKTYSVTISAGAGGTVSPLGSKIIGQVTKTTVTATPDANYEFVNWTATGGVVVANTTSASTTITATDNGTLTANFRSTASNSLTVVTGAGIASVTGSTDPVTLGNTYTITATPKTGYTFSTWTADPAANATFGSATTAETTVTVKNGSVSVTASATENMSTLTTSNKYDAGDPGYELPAASVNSIGYETTAEVTAAAAGNGYTFTGWTLTNCTRTDGGAADATSIIVRSNGDGKAATIVAIYAEDLTSTYYVRGDNAGPFSEGWNANPNTMMKKHSGYANSNDVYWEIDVPQSKVTPNDDQWEFKIYNDAGSDDNKKWLGWGSGDAYYWLTKENNNLTLSTSGSNNIRFKPYLVGTYTFHVNYDNPSSPTLEVIWPTLNQICFYSAQTGGSGTDTYEWENTSSTTWTKTISLSKGTHYFKVLENSEYFGNTGTMTRGNCSGWTMSSTTKNCGITADVAGDYLFSYNTSTNKLTVTYPEAYTVTYSHVPTAAADAPTTNTSITSGDYVLANTGVTFTAKDANNGYTWKGWYNNEAGDGDALSTNKAYTKSITATTSIYAVYTEKTTNVTINANDGSLGTLKVDGATQDWGYSTSVGVATTKLITATPKDNSYEFTGWTLIDNVITSDDTKNTTITIKGNGNSGLGTVTANFQKIIRTITFDREGGAGSIETLTATYGEATTPITPPTKTGYTFEGYWTEDNGTGTQIVNTDGTWIASKVNFTDANNKWIVTSNKTLYAKWEEIKYNLSTRNDYDHGKPDYAAPTKSPNQIGVSTTATVTASNTLKGYTFVGWNLVNCVRTDNGAATATSITVRHDGNGGDPLVEAKYEEDLTSNYVVRGGAKFGPTWDSANEMTKLSGRSYEDIVYFTVEIDAANLGNSNSDFQFKIYDTSSSGKWWGFNTYDRYYNYNTGERGMETPGENIELRAKTVGSYTIKVDYRDPEHLKLTINFPSSDLYIVGFNDDWATTPENKFTETDGIATISKLIPAGDHQFKLKDGNGGWRTMSATPRTITRSNHTADFSDFSDGAGTNTTLKADVKGIYTFTYSFATNEFNVTYPALVTLSDGVSEAVSSSQTRATLTSVPGQMVTATPTMDIGVNGNTFCWKLYDKGQDIDHLETTVDINFISLGNGKITFELPKVTGTYYLQLTTHTGADCSDETLIETIICPINVSTENTVFFQDESGKWKNVYVYFYGEGGYWHNTYGSGAKNITSHKMTRINGTNIFYYNYGNITTYKYIAFTDHNQGYGQGDEGLGYQWFDQCQVVYRGDFNNCVPLYVMDYNGGKDYRNQHDGKQTCYYRDGYWTTYMGTSSGYWLHISGNDVDDPNHEMTTTTVGKRVYTHKVSLEGNQTPYELWFRGCNGTYYGVESNMTVTNCTEWNLYSGDASVNLYATAAGDYTFILYCNPDGHFQLSVEFPVAKGDFQLVYDDERQTPHPSDYIRSSTVDGKLDTVSMYIRGESGTGKTLKVQRCTGFSNNGNPQWETLKTYNNADFSGLNLTKDTVYNFHMEQTVSTQTIDIKSTEFYSGKYYVRTKAADGGWDAYATEADNQMTYTEYSSHLPFDPYTHYFCKWVDDSNKDDVSYTVACDYAKALSDTLEGDNYTVNANSHALPEKANVRFTYDNRTNGLKRAYLTGASDSDFDDFLKLTKTKDGTTMKPGKNASDVSHVKLQDEENWVYATEIYVTSAESDGGGYSFDAMLTAVYPKSAVNNPEKKQYFFAKKNDNGTYAGETLIGGTDGSEQLVTIRYDFKTNRLMRAWKPSDEEIDDEVLPLSADILLIREGQNAAEQLVFTDPTKNKITNVKTIFGALEFKYDNMVGKLGTGNWNHTSYHYCRYYVSFPFDVRISEIFGAGNYGEDYIIQKYNGTKRAEIGWFAETETFWETMDKSEKLNKYEGYCVMLNRTPFNDGNSHVWKNKKAGSSVYLYFPSASHKDDWTINAIGDVVIPIPEHQCNIDRDFTQDIRDGKNPPRNHKNTDSHWNMVGTPLFQNATAATIADDGPEVEEGDGYAEQGTRLQYVFDWINTVETPNGTAARKAWNTDFEFKAMHSYLIQYAGEVTFRGSHIANHVPSSVAARRAAEEVKNYTVELQLDRDSAFASRTYVELQENAEDGFLLNEDMYMGSSSPIANLYTYAGAYDVAANVLSVNSHIVPVGVQVKQAGTYTFSMTTPFDGTVTLIDYHTGSRTNLGWSDYTVTLEKGTINDRFALEINIQNVSTDVEGNTGHFKGKDAVKFLHNGILYIKKGDAIYDARGSRVSMSYEL